MRYLLYIHLVGFYHACLPESGDRTIVVYRDKEVLDVSPIAASRGVRPQMSIAEAKAILAGDGEFLRWEAETYARVQERWLEVCTEFTDVIEPVEQHSAYIDLSSHGLPLPLVARLRERLAEAGFHPRIGLAGSRWVAHQAAFRDDPEHKALLTPRRFVAPLPIRRMPIPEEQARHLVRLGYRTVGDLARLPIEVLRTQFDASAYEIARLAQGGGEAVVTPLFPPDSVTARFAFESSPETRAALWQGIEEMATALAERLVLREQVGKRLELSLEYEDGSTERRSRTFARPIASAHDLLTAAGLLLTPIPETPISTIRIRMPQLESAQRVQLEIDGSRGDRERGATAALQHVRAVFGNAAVQVAGEVREPRWKRLRRAFSAANGWAWV